MQTLPGPIIKMIYLFINNWSDSAAFRSCCKKYRVNCMPLPRDKFSNKELMKNNDPYQFLIHPIILKNDYDIYYDSKKIHVNSVYFHCRNGNVEEIMDIRSSLGFARYCFADNNLTLFGKYLNLYTFNSTIISQLILTKKHVKRFEFLELITKCDIDYQSASPELLVIRYVKPDGKFIKKISKIPNFRLALLECTKYKETYKFAKIIYRHVDLTNEEQNDYIVHHRYGSSIMQYFPNADAEPFYDFKYLMRKYPDTSINIFKKCVIKNSFKCIQTALVYGRQDVAVYLANHIDGSDYIDDSSYEF